MSVSRKNIYVKIVKKSETSHVDTRGFYQETIYDLPTNKDGDINYYEIDNLTSFAEFNIEIEDIDARFELWKERNESQITATKVTADEFYNAISETYWFRNEINILNEERNKKLQKLSSMLNGVKYDTDEEALDRLDRIITIQTANMLKDLASGTNAKVAYKNNFTDFVFAWNDKAGRQRLLNVEDAIKLQTESLYNLVSVWTGVEASQVPEILKELVTKYKQLNSKSREEA